MKSHRQVRTDERDNARVLRWVVVLVVVLLVAALGYNLLARQGVASDDRAPAAIQSASCPGTALGLRLRLRLVA